MSTTGNTQGAVQFIEPATIVTMTVAAVYLIGWSLMGGYFHRIGIPQHSLELSNIYYFEAGSGTVITVWLVYGCIVIGASAMKFRFLFKSLPLLLVVAWCTVLLYTSPHSARHIFLIGGIQAIVIGLPVLFISPKPLLNLVPDSFREKIILSIFLYTLLIVGSRFCGDYLWQKMIEGRSYASVTVVFDWKDKRYHHQDWKARHSFLFFTMMAITMLWKRKIRLLSCRMFS